MVQNSSFSNVWPLLWKPALAGIACGILFGIASTLINWIWKNEYSNTNLSLLINLPHIAIVLLLILLSAFLAVTFAYGYIKKPAEALLPGAIAGVAFIQAAFLFSTILMLVMLSPLFTYKEPGMYNMFDGFREDPVGYFIDFYSVGAGYMAVYSLMTMVLTSAVAAVYTLLVQKQSGEEKRVRRTNRVSIAIIVSMVVILLIVPPAIAYVGLNMGWIDKSWNDYYRDYAGTITASRAGEDMIYINYTGSSDLKLDSGMPILIDINGKNATNMEAIGQSGLNASISPAEGLKNVKDASVTITGDDILPATHQEAYNYTYNGTHVVIIYVRHDGQRDVVNDIVL